MSGRKLAVGIAVSASISMVLSTMSFGAGLEIRQEGYLYRMPLTQDVYTQTFVISPATSQEETSIVEPDSTPVAHFTNPIVVYFQIDHSTISPDEARKLRSDLLRQKVPQTTPLTVTGYTCRKGPERFNEWLSKERAKAVAILLQEDGYTVARIEGRGASNPVSTSHHPINRRVEITVFVQ